VNYIHVDRPGWKRQFQENGIIRIIIDRFTSSFAVSNTMSMICADIKKTFKEKVYCNLCATNEIGDVVVKGRKARELVQSNPEHYRLEIICRSKDVT
jgi:hypothetical protein